MRRFLFVCMLLILSQSSNAQTRTYKLIKSVSPESGELIRDYSETERYKYITFTSFGTCYISDDLGNNLGNKTSSSSINAGTSSITKMIIRESGRRSLDSYSYSRPMHSSSYDYSTSDGLYRKISERDGVVTYMCVTTMYENGSRKYERRDFLHFSSDYSRLNIINDSVYVDAMGAEFKPQGILGRVNSSSCVDVYIGVEKSPHSPQKIW